MDRAARLASTVISLIGLSHAMTNPVGAVEPEAVGTFTAVQGQVQMTQPGAAVPVSVKLSDAVIYKALIETQESSRAKALFLDDSMLAVAENSKVRISEQIYDPKHGKRSMVFNLLEGKVRALVTKVFQGQGSRFEIRTPTAVAAARGTYFVVWVEKGVAEQGAAGGHQGQGPVAAPGEAVPVSLPNREFTGIANIGDSGSVDFTSSGQTVTVKPGHFAVAVPGQPPVSPMPLAKSIPSQVSQAIRATSVVNAPKPETPREMFQATTNVGPSNPAQFPPNMGSFSSGMGLGKASIVNPGSAAVPPGQSGMTPGQSGTAPGQSGMAPGLSGMTPGQSSMAAGMPAPTTTVVATPPAAMSGAMNSANAPGKIPVFVNRPTPGYVTNGRGGGPPGH
jgi:hypothetical protein